MPLKKAKLTPHLYTNCADLNMGIGIYCRFFSIALQDGHIILLIENKSRLFAQDQAPLPIPQCAGEQVMIPAIANRQPFFQVLDRAGKVS